MEAAQFGFVFCPNGTDAFLVLPNAPFPLGQAGGRIGPNLYHLSDDQVDWPRYERDTIRDIRENAPKGLARMRNRREELQKLFGDGFTFQSRTAEVWAYGCPHANGESRAVVESGMVPDKVRQIINKPGLANCDNGTEDGCVVGKHRVHDGEGMQYSVSIECHGSPKKVVGGEVAAMAGIHWAQGKRHIDVRSVPCTVTIRLVEPVFTLPEEVPAEISPIPA